MASIALAALLLAGCSVLSEGGETAPSRLSTRGAAPAGTSFPNLGSVPDAPPPASSAAERQAVTEALKADRTDAEYTGGASAE